jgi:hypothetical protein
MSAILTSNIAFGCLLGRGFLRRSGAKLTVKVRQSRSMLSTGKQLRLSWFLAVLKANAEKDLTLNDPRSKASTLVPLGVGNLLAVLQGC